MKGSLLWDRDHIWDVRGEVGNSMFFNTLTSWLVVWNFFPHIYIYWEESSQLTNIFQRG